MRKLTHGSLFSGIGGFDLAAEWMEWENVFHCEWNEFGQKVLNYYWPNAESFTDITKTDFTKYANEIDILTGGFPCQPFSLAGKRKGTDDERYLWGEMLRAIKEIKPQFVIAENVYGITNIDGGLVFEQVCIDLENEGYEVQPFIIPAAAKNAPHRRDRCWFVATNSKCSGEIQRSKNIQSNKPNGYQFIRNGRKQNATNTNSNGLNERNGNNEINPSQGRKYALGNIEPIPFDSKCIGRTAIWYDNGQFKTPQQSKCRKQQFSGADSTQSWWRNFPTKPPICGGDDGLLTELDGITFPKWRSESIKAYGNAIVPQVAFQIFKSIEKTLYL